MRFWSVFIGWVCASNITAPVEDESVPVRVVFQARAANRAVDNVYVPESVHFEAFAKLVNDAKTTFDTLSELVKKCSEYHDVLVAQRFQLDEHFEKVSCSEYMYGDLCLAHKLQEEEDRGNVPQNLVPPQGSNALVEEQGAELTITPPDHCDCGCEDSTPIDLSGVKLSFGDEGAVSGNAEKEQEDLV